MASWFYRRCEVCGHSIKPIYWVSGRLVAHVMCHDCENKGSTHRIRNRAFQPPSRSIDIYDFIDLDLATNIDAAYYEDCFYIYNGGATILLPRMNDG